MRRERTHRNTQKIIARDLQDSSSPSVKLQLFHLTKNNFKEKNQEITSFLLRLQKDVIPRFFINLNLSSL